MTVQKLKFFAMGFLLSIPAVARAAQSWDFSLPPNYRATFYFQSTTFPAPPVATVSNAGAMIDQFQVSNAEPDIKVIRPNLHPRILRLATTYKGTRLDIQSIAVSSPPSGSGQPVDQDVLITITGQCVFPPDTTTTTCFARFEMTSNHN